MVIKEKFTMFITQTSQLSYLLSTVTTRIITSLRTAFILLISPIRRTSDVVTIHPPLISSSLTFLKMKMMSEITG